jgi:hypothetical protein
MADCAENPRSELINSVRYSYLKLGFIQANYFRLPVPGPQGLRGRSAAALLVRLWVRIRPGEWMSVCRECCVLSGISFSVGLITRPE